jgi:hypothetical protein
MYPDQKWLSWKKFNTLFPKLKRLSYGYFGDTYIQDDVVCKVMYNCKRSREEIDIMRLVTSSNSMFLSSMFVSYYCNNAEFFGHKKRGVFKCWNNWEKVKKGNGLIIVMEYSGIPLADYIQTHTFNKSMLFMMIYSLYIFRKTTRMYHNDTWITNFTVKRIQKQDISFTISGSQYFLKGVTHVPVLIDYGKSGKYLTTDNETDVSTLLSDMYKYTSKSFINKIKQYTHTAQVIYHHFKEFKKNNYI